MNARTIGATVVITGGVLLVASGLGYWKYSSIKSSMNNVWPEMPQTVQVATAEEGSFQRAMSVTGTIWALRHVMLSTELAGKVTDVGFESGQTVEEGALLVRLDSSTEQADLRSAEAAAELSRVTLDRMKEPGLGRAVSQQDIDKAQAEFDQTRARVEQLKATIAKKEIRAAFKGKVGMRDIHPGQYLAEGSKITSLQGVDDHVHVDFWVPQLQAAGLHVGSTVGVVAGSIELPAQVVAMDAQIEQTTRNVRIRGATSSMGGRLAPGMFVDVRVPLGDPVKVVTAPPTAIRHAPFGDHLFVIEPDPKDPAKLRAHQRFVKLGGAAGDRIIIADGLKPGEKLAADGSFKLREGALVAPGAETAVANKPKEGEG